MPACKDCTKSEVPIPSQRMFSSKLSVHDSTSLPGSLDVLESTSNVASFHSNVVDLECSAASIENESAFAGSTMRYAYLVLSYLLLIYILNQFDVYLISYMKQAMQDSIGFTDAEYGLLMGYGTTVVYALCGVVFAFVADRVYSRRFMVLFGLGFWSVMIVAQGLSQTFWQLLLAKIGLGVGLAASTPCMFALIPDYFPHNYAPIANSILFYGIYVGEGLSSTLGGTLSDLENFGWRKTLYITGFFGFLVAIIGWFVIKEPVRGRYFVALNPSLKRKVSISSDNVCTMKDTLLYILSLQSFWRTVVAAGFRMLAGYSFGAYMPSFLKSNYPNYAQQVNIIYGLVVMFSGMFASYVGGFITSKYVLRFSGIGLVVSGVGSLGTIPFVVVMLYARDIVHDEFYSLVLTFSSMVGAYLFAEAWLGSCVSTIQMILPTNLATTGYASFNMLINFIGGAGPEIIGLTLTGLHIDSDNADITKQYILYVIVGAYAMSAPWFFWASTFVCNDYEKRIFFDVEAPLGWTLHVSFVRKAMFAFCFTLLFLIMVALITLSFTGV